MRRSFSRRERDDNVFPAGDLVSTRTALSPVWDEEVAGPNPATDQLFCDLDGRETLAFLFSGFL